MDWPGGVFCSEMSTIMQITEGKQCSTPNPNVQAHMLHTERPRLYNKFGGKKVFVQQMTIKYQEEFPNDTMIHTLFMMVMEMLTVGPSLADSKLQLEWWAIIFIKIEG